jgi:hypothetical protein
MPRHPRHFPSSHLREGRAWTLASIASMAALCVAACATPTLPLPPPEAPTQAPGIDADHVELSADCGGAEGGALIVVLNQSVAPDLAVGGSEANACGAWDASIYAHSGDVLSITQQAGGVSSGSTTVQVQ